ncbi:hypothetical protein DL93DRAFT_1395713 [Clavulina sp. PMI_390]|nr:hypothetical protein DL93DRAFT_1395713 [Clavulina sp. PMI_390]
MIMMKLCVNQERLGVLRSEENIMDLSNWLDRIRVTIIWVEEPESPTLPDPPPDPGAPEIPAICRIGSDASAKTFIENPSTSSTVSTLTDAAHGKRVTWAAEAIVHGYSSTDPICQEFLVFEHSCHHRCSVEPRSLHSAFRKTKPMEEPIPDTKLSGDFRQQLKRSLAGFQKGVTRLRLPSILLPQPTRQLGDCRIPPSFRIC